MKKSTKLLGLSAAAALLISAPALAQDIKIGFLADLTGPIAGFAPGIVDSGNLALATANNNGGLLDGRNAVSVVADTACDGPSGGPGGDRMVNTENVTAIFGAYCSGPVISAATTAAIPGNVVVITPAGSAPAISDLEDNDLVFRNVVPDTVQGVKMAELLISKGITNVGVTYVNNDYGKGLADAFSAAFTAGGGTVAASVAHEDGKSDYRPEVGQIESSGTEALVILGYENAGGGVILNQAVETGSFKQYVGGDGMAGEALIASRDAAALDGMILTRAAPAGGPAYEAFVALTAGTAVDPAGVYTSNGYDSAFLLLLAIEKNGNADRAGLSAALREVANAPGEVILPGEWKKAKELIAAGTDINYQGASGEIEFDAKGDVAGAIENFVITGGAIVNNGLIP